MSSSSSNNPDTSLDAHAAPVNGESSQAVATESQVAVQASDQPMTEAAAAAYQSEQTQEWPVTGDTTIPIDAPLSSRGASAPDTHHQGRRSSSSSSSSHRSVLVHETIQSINRPRRGISIDMAVTVTTSGHASGPLFVHHWWYHVFINFLEPFLTLIGSYQALYHPRTFLYESLPNIEYDHQWQPLITEVVGGWTLVLFLEVFLLSPFPRVSEWGKEVEMWKFAIRALMVSDVLYWYSFVQDAGSLWAVIWPGHWDNALQGLSIVLTAIGSITRIAFLVGLGRKTTEEQDGRVRLD